MPKLAVNEVESPGGNLNDKQKNEGVGNFRKSPSTSSRRDSSSRDLQSKTMRMSCPNSACLPIEASGTNPVTQAAVRKARRKKVYLLAPLPPSLPRKTTVINNNLILISSQTTPCLHIQRFLLLPSCPKLRRSESLTKASNCFPT